MASSSGSSSTPPRSARRLSTTLTRRRSPSLVPASAVTRRWRPQPSLVSQKWRLADFLLCAGLAGGFAPRSTPTQGPSQRLDRCICAAKLSIRAPDTAYRQQGRLCASTVMAHAARAHVRATAARTCCCCSSTCRCTRQLLHWLLAWPSSSRCSSQSAHQVPLRAIENQQALTCS